MDEPRACYTESSKSEKNKYHVYSIYMESIKMIFMYLFARNGDTDVENGLVDTAWEGEDGTN